MFFGSLVVISTWLQCLHTGVPHPMQDVSVWIPHAQTSSFRAVCIEIPLSCLVEAVNLYERDCHFYAKGEGSDILRVEIKKSKKIKKQVIGPSIYTHGNTRWHWSVCHKFMASVP
jgi:hypothetical protein